MDADNAIEYTDPTYYDFFIQSSTEIVNFWNKLEPESFHFDTMYSSVVSNWHFRLSDCVNPFLFGIGIGLVRKLIEWLVHRMTKTLNFTPSDLEKLPSSILSVLAYSTFFIWECFIVFKYDYFLDPAACFRNWNQAKLQPAPANVRWLYVAVLGWYFEAFVQCTMIEVRRKDTNVMICHHIATIFLITFSLGMRFWQIGCLVLFCHDICDIFLDASKIFVYIQNRPGASNSTKIICEVVKTLGFVCFVLSWILFRFHFYPRKALYSVMYHSQHLIPGGPPCYLFYSFLLVSIQLMHIYWFYFILKLLFKIAIGDLQKLEDTREKKD